VLNTEGDYNVNAPVAWGCGTFLCLVL